ncbi:MAG: cytochrome C oxidase subunit IV family protein [Bacillota bacterium]
MAHADHSAKGHVHPGPSRAGLMTLAGILLLITLVEWGVVFITGMRGLVLSVLAVLSVAKFLAVAGIFMHLRFDHRLLGWTFGIGVFNAVWMTIALIAVLQA